MTTLLDEFKAITEGLEAVHVDYAICGGWAMAIHGLARATLDIDMMVLAEDLGEAWKIAEELGYDVEGLPLHFAKGAIEIRRISKVDADSKQLFTIDFLLVTDQTKEIWSNRELVDWGESQTWVVSLRGLISLKKISGREQDLIDIKKLEEVADES